MKQICFIISTVLLVLTLFSSNGFAQGYVHYSTLIGHTNIVSAVSFSSDGRMIASGGWDGTIRLWDVGTGKLKVTLIGHTGFVHSISFSSNGRILASGDGLLGDNTIRLWDTTSGAHLRTLTGHTNTVISVSFSPDGRTLASGSSDGTVCLWEVATSSLKNTLTGDTTGAVFSVCFSPDGRTLASGSSDKTICLWDATTGMRLRTLIGHTNTVISVSFSPDGRTLASGSSDGTVCLWDATTGKHLQTLTGHTDHDFRIAFSPDGRTLASGSVDNTICLWDVTTGTHLQTLTGHTATVWSVSFSPDGRTLASGSLDKTIRLWRISNPTLVYPNPPTPPTVSANQVYDSTIRAVMWIVNPGIGEGSGALIDKKSKLAITNAHVTGTQNTIDVYFPAPDENGELIKDRNFYLTNSNVLKRLGYYTKGRVVARNEKTDLAIIRLDGLPETTREIDWDFTPPTTNAGDLVYILGNPGGQDLWRWTLGEFLKDPGDFLHIQSDVFGGNSGGPVLNKQGVLIGIVARSDRHMNALAIPARHLNQLLSESQLKHSRSHR